MTTMDAGSFSKERAPVESMQFSFSARPGIGGFAFTEPVAIIIASGVMLSELPSDFLIITLLGPVKLASPSITFTLFALSSAATPEVS